jgi:hypothetical protein
MRLHVFSPEIEGYDLFADYALISGRGIAALSRYYGGDIAIDNPSMIRHPVSK